MLCVWFVFVVLHNLTAKLLQWLSHKVQLTELAHFIMWGYRLDSFFSCLCVATLVGGAGDAVMPRASMAFNSSYLKPLPTAFTFWSRAAISLSFSSSVISRVKRMLVRYVQCICLWGFMGDHYLSWRSYTCVMFLFTTQTMICRELVLLLLMCWMTKPESCHVRDATSYGCPLKHWFSRGVCINFPCVAILLHCFCIGVCC